MLTRQDKERLRHELQHRRDELLAMRRDINRRWTTQQAPEVEMEEEAQKAKLAKDLDSLQEHEKKMVLAMEDALQRLADGTYGQCADCGKEIGHERLEAVPWTKRCVKCAESAEPEPGQPRLVPEEGPDVGLPVDYSGMEDGALARAVMDKVMAWGGIDAQELDVRASKGVVYLEGAMPSPEQRERLLELVQDDMGLEDVVDNLRMDPQLWARRSRAPEPERGRTDTDDVLEGEGPEQETFTAMKDGVPLQPGDHIKPDGEE
jgi:DnaK suppressor protein